MRPMETFIKSYKNRYELKKLAEKTKEKTLENAKSI
jgi:hypothetical protein